jgi:hypothetical protein
MHNDNNDRKRRIAHEVLVFLGILALMTLIMRLWPVFLLVLVGILICALRMLFLRVRTVEVIVPAPAADTPPSETELSIIQKAFGLMQRRISEQLDLRFPGARWVWEMPNALERFRYNEPLIVLLNRAGGYNKAQVMVHNLLFHDLRYCTLETETDFSVVDPDPFGLGLNEDPADTGDPEPAEDAPMEDEPINYGRLAFEWVDANTVDISAKYNEAIAQNESGLFIPAAELPHPDSWPDVCAELKRSGFTAADFCEDGITVKITP